MFYFYDLYHFLVFQYEVYLLENRIAMEDKKEELMLFCKHLGKLFYAVSLIDNKIKKEEFQAMEKAITSELYSMNNTVLMEDTTANETIINTFKQLYFDKAEAQQCYDDFISFKSKNESLFTKEIKKVVLKIAGKIASSFSGVNKSELIILAKLSIAFKEEKSK